MFVNLIKMMKEGVEVNVSITEFYPLIDGKTIVPVSRVSSKHAMYVFGDIIADAYSVYGLEEDDILSKEDYIKELDKFIKKVNDQGDGEVDKFFENEDMYRRYRSGIRNLLVSGVVCVLDTSDNVTPENISDVPTFTPADGIKERLDIESYWKSLRFVMPNIVADISTVFRMYQNYLTENDFNKKEANISSSLILEVSNIRELVDTVREALEDTDLAEREVLKLIRDGDVEGSSKMKEYYRTMLNEHNVSQTQAAGLLLYIFESHYKNIYDDSDLSDVYKTNTPVVLSLPAVKRTVGNTYKSIV
ncbi:MAG: hypothetical protein ACRCX2_36305 [Paraclostridium sp.]